MGLVLCATNDVLITETTQFVCYALVLPNMIVILSSIVLGALIAAQIQRDWLKPKYGARGEQ